MITNKLKSLKLRIMEIIMIKIAKTKISTRYSYLIVVSFRTILKNLYRKSHLVL